MDYKNLSSKDMLNLVNENFYNLIPTKEDFVFFVRNFVDKFCLDHNVRGGVKLKYCNSEYYEMYYVAQKKCVNINDFYVKKYEEFAKSRNYYFLKNFFDGIVHELRHHMQYNSSDISPLLKNYMILNYLEDSHDLVARIPYDTRPHEIDARYFTYKELKDLSFFSKYYKMQAFVEEERKIDFDSYQFVELLKDEDLDDIKKLAGPRKVLELLTKKIALENGLRFDKTNNLDLKNDYKLNIAIGKTLAPEFFSRKFKKIKNPRKVEKLLNQERNDFIDKYDEYEEEINQK